MPQDFKSKFRSAITFFEIPSFYQLSNHHIISQMCTCDVSKVKPEDVTRQFLGASIYPNGPKWTQKDPNGPKWTQMATQMDPNGPKWRPKWTNSDFE